MLSATQAAAEACESDLSPLADLFEDIAGWLSEQDRLDPVDLWEATQLVRLFGETQRAKEDRFRQPTDTAPAQQAIAQAIERATANGDILDDTTGQAMMAIARVRREIDRFDPDGNRRQPNPNRQLGYFRQTHALISENWLW